MKKTDLKKKIIAVLKEQGLDNNAQSRSIIEDKNKYREIQKYSRSEQIFIHINFLNHNYKVAKDYLVDINKFNPQAIDLELREVKNDSLEEILFKWWNLVWWSIPYQRAYGRQMRFILWDRGHNAPFGLIGLQSPILKMSVRDKYLKLPKDELDIWVNRSIQAQRLGALPPYNLLIGGKMVAMAMTSNDIRIMYRDKYKDCQTEMLGRVIEPDLLFATTTSAFGHSSIYNRLKYLNEPLAISLGFTKGYGSFQIPESLYKEIRIFLKEQGYNVGTTFGNGPSRKIKLFDIAFRLLKMDKFSNHNLRREYFLFPFVSNLNEVIQNHEQPIFYNRPLNSLTDFWMERWCIPRAKRNNDWKLFSANDFINNAKDEILKIGINGRST